MGSRTGPMNDKRETQRNWVIKHVLVALETYITEIAYLHVHIAAGQIGISI